MNDPNRPDEPLYGFYTGVVKERDDPEKLGRVRIVIPGFIEEGTAWALPLGGLGGGGPQRGAMFVPPVGAEVGVFFRLGDVDQPYYIAGNLGRGEQLTGTDGDPDVQAIETDKYIINIDDRPEFKNLTIQDKASGDLIQLNGRDRAIIVKATTAIKIEAEGFLYLNGLEVFINGVQAGLGKL